MLENNKYKKLLLAEKEIKRNGMHSFHRYFGKLIPAIPSFAIKNFTTEGDFVLDSFSGSGTTMLETKLLNRNGYGIDINPLSAFIAKIKTTKVNDDQLSSIIESIKSDFYKDKKDYSNDLAPYVVNIDHWFKDFVKADLLKLRRHIGKLPDGDVKDFLLGCFSAFLRGVSNADPQHVFPGYSKRLRRLDEEGGREIDVFKSFERSVKRRIQYMSSLPDNKAKINILHGDSRELPKSVKNISLVVTNPPYISSIRYLETMKIEMGWLEFIRDQAHYLDMDSKIVGTERFYKKSSETIEKTGLKLLDKQVDNLVSGDQLKMAKVVSKYFSDMQNSISEMHRVLKPGGHIVFKISDSSVRGEYIPTSKYLVQIAENLGMKKVAVFEDKIDDNSRSLLTTRNSYSGIMTHDWILILQK